MEVSVSAGPIWPKLAARLLVVIAISLSVDEEIANASDFSARTQPSLSTALVTIEDVMEGKSSELISYMTAYDDGELTIVDRTAELKMHCALDCVKSNWYVPVRGFTPDGFRRLTIVMIRMSSTEQARLAAVELYERLKPATIVSHPSIDDLLYNKKKLPENAWTFDNGNYTLGASYGSITLLFIQRVRGYRELDGSTEIVALATLAQMQIGKLQASGFAP